MEFDVTEKQRLIREFEEKTEDDKSVGFFADFF